MARNGFKVLDSDMHVMEPPDLWERYIDPAFRDRAPVFKGAASSHGFTNKWIVEGKVFPAYSDRKPRAQVLKGRHEAISDRFERPRAQLFDTTTQLEALEIEGIDVAVLFRTFGAHVIALDGMDPALVSAICRAFNNWLAEFCAADRTRLKGAAQMPMHQVEGAVQEARRAVKELGMVALVLPSNPVNERPWYDPYYDPFWEEAQGLGVPVCFHGIQGAYQQHIGTRFLDSFVIAHAATHPIELMLDVGAMIGGGVLERYPDLQVGFLEGNCSWLPWWLWRLDEEWEVFGAWEQIKLKALPSEYFKNRCYVSVDVDEFMVEYVLQRVGDDNLVLSTDYPHHDSAYPHALEIFLSMDVVPEASRKKILWDNSARLYSL